MQNSFETAKNHVRSWCVLNAFYSLHSFWSEELNTPCTKYAIYHQKSNLRSYFFPSLSPLFHRIVLACELPVAAYYYNLHLHFTFVQINLEIISINFNVKLGGSRKNIDWYNFNYSSGWWIYFYRAISTNASWR